MSKADVGERGSYGVLFGNQTMDFMAGMLLAHAQQGGMSVGALLHCFSLISDGSVDSWRRVFAEAAAHSAEQARIADQNQRHPEAASAWLATAVAQRASLMMTDPTSAAAVNATAAMEQTFALFLAAARVPLERWRVRIGGGVLPGYVSAGFRAADQVIVVIGGGDTYAEDLWFFGGRALIEAGYAVAMVDLPGQGATPAQGLQFGEATLEGLTEVLRSLRRAGFSGEVVLLGWSGGGIFVTKYASLARPEDRLRAVIASPPIHDAEAMLRKALPAVLQREPDSKLLRLVLAVARRNAVLGTAIAKYQWQFGPRGIAGVLADLGDLGRTDLDALEVPMLGLVGLGEDAEGLRQARPVIDAARRRWPASELITFDAWSGADSHCQVGNLPLALTRIIGWLEGLEASASEPAGEPQPAVDPS
jgi:pimeloyl-ACP methyl ester carboxylesterase